MYRAELNERSPLRVFERSIHGGLGRGRVGAVVARPGVGKSPLLVQIGLDHLLRDRRVLHISHQSTVDHVRSYYSEIFHDLSQSAALSSADAVKLELERHRLIFSLMPPAEGAAAASSQDTQVSRILQAVGFARDVAQFVPDVLIIDGFDLAPGNQEALRTLGALARELEAELWISVCPEAEPSGPGLPAPLDGFAAWIDVVVHLSPEQDFVRLSVLKDHDNPSTSHMNLKLDSHTMRLIEGRSARPSPRPQNPRQFRLVSGGSAGAEAEFGACAERWGLTEVHYTFEGHQSLVRRRGVRVLDESELKMGDFSLVYASRRLGRELSDIPQVRRVLQTIWHQVTDARQVFAIGALQPNGTLRGGTGWGAELARLWDKPLFVFDQARSGWFYWAGRAWEPSEAPVISRQVFAGIGTQHLSHEGRAAIEALFRRSFGEPPE